MSSTPKKPVEIQKEFVGQLKFPREEVLKNPDLQKERTQSILNATRLGNGSKIKVKIIFEDSEGLKLVYTTIWGATPNFIILKRGVTIPINRIHFISAY
ncbi:MAG: hypothetical protein D6707_00610 [Bacteroidetes bacterium]|nr:MAG: hypothetical protein D6707_00610 [Bacteroidota bacterium]